MSIYKAGPLLEQINIPSDLREKFKIDETYRFEGDSNPSDEDIVYAISSLDGKIKGIFTGAFGIYADNSI